MSDYYFNEVAEIIKNKIDIQRKLKYFQNFSNNIIQKKTLKRLRLSLEARRVTKILQECSFLKDYNKATQAQIFYFLGKIFDEIGERISLNNHQVRTLSPQELKNLLVKKRPLTKDLNWQIKERMKYYLIKTGRKRSQVLYGQQALILENKYFKPTVKGKLKELKGKTACPGLAKGKVKIIAVLKDLAKFKKGDVLVTNNTTPDFLPAMKKAAAIICEEGGITCHAAIVSRELGVPCLVGVDMATKLLSNQNLVEIDATKGIVKILK